jgi:hypothetical protein
MRMDVGIILPTPLVLIRHTRQDRDVHVDAVEPTPAASSENWRIVAAELAAVEVGARHGCTLGPLTAEFRPFGQPLHFTAL